MLSLQAFVGTMGFLVVSITILILLFWIYLSISLMGVLLGSQRYASRSVNVLGITVIWKMLSAYIFSFSVVAIFSDLAQNGIPQFSFGFFGLEGPLGGLILWIFSFITFALVLDGACRPLLASLGRADANKTDT